MSTSPTAIRTAPTRATPSWIARLAPGLKVGLVTLLLADNAPAQSPPAQNPAPAFTPGSAQPFTPPPPPPAPRYASGPPPPSPQLPPPGEGNEGDEPDEAAEPEDPRIANAHADRVSIMPTAYTHPEGTFYVSSYEIVMLQVGYAFSDDAQISLTGLPPISEDILVPLDLTVKWRFFEEGLARFAFLGSVTGLFGLDEGDFVVGRVGGVGQMCFSEACTSSLNFGTTALLAGPATILATGLGLIGELTSWAHLLVEADLLTPLGTEATQFNGLAGSAVIRFPARSWALDLGAIASLDAAGGNQAIPWLAVGYRFLP